MRTPFFLAYDAENCTHVRLNSKEIDDMVKSGQAVSAKFVIPYPPGFPIMVPGQVITKETIDFMRKLDGKEIHGYQAAWGLELIKPEKLGASRRKNASPSRRAAVRARDCQQRPAAGDLLGRAVRIQPGRLRDGRKACRLPPRLRGRTLLGLADDLCRDGTLDRCHQPAGPGRRPNQGLPR